MVSNTTRRNPNNAARYEFSAMNVMQIGSEVSTWRIDGPPVPAVGGIMSPGDCPPRLMWEDCSFLTRPVLNGRAVRVRRLPGSRRMSEPERLRSLALVGRAIKELRNSGPFSTRISPPHLMHLRCKQSRSRGSLNPLHCVVYRCLRLVNAADTRRRNPSK